MQGRSRRAARARPVRGRLRGVGPQVVTPPRPDQVRLPLARYQAVHGGARLRGGVAGLSADLAIYSAACVILSQGKCVVLGGRRW
eukprot:2643983-Pyramimonas_sp.AAC.1